MNNDKSLLTLLGSAVSVVGTALQTDEVLKIVSLIITIIGGILTIILNAVRWRKEASKDGKITGDEIEDLISKLKDNVEDVKDEIDRKDNE